MTMITCSRPQRPPFLRRRTPPLSETPPCCSASRSWTVMDACVAINASNKSSYLSPPDAVTRLLSDPSFVRAPAIVIRRQAFDDRRALRPDCRKSDRLRYVASDLLAIRRSMSAHDDKRLFRARGGGDDDDVYGRDRADELSKSSIAPQQRASCAPHVLRTCEADFFHQFILAGASRRLGVGDRRGAADIMALFQMPEIRALGVSRRWRPVRICMQRLVGLPARLSRAVARALQYHPGLTRFVAGCADRFSSTRPLQEDSGVPIARR